eukprot:878609-Pelagomonas_calceolata.AAC.2
MRRGVARCQMHTRSSRCRSCWIGGLQTSLQTRSSQYQGKVLGRPYSVQCVVTGRAEWRIPCNTNPMVVAFWGLCHLTSALRTPSARMHVDADVMQNICDTLQASKGIKWQRACKIEGC